MLATTGFDLQLTGDDFTVFVVNKFGASQVGPEVRLWGRDYSIDGPMAARDNGSNNFYIAYLDDSNVFRGADALPLINPYPSGVNHLFHVRKGGTTHSEYIDGVVQFTKTEGSATTKSAGSVPFTMGASNGVVRPWAGDILELIYYNRSLSNAEVTQVKGYIATKYGLTIA
jgi:hypothetical protein